MAIADAIVLVAIEATRQADGALLIDGERHNTFPEQLSIEGTVFEFSEQEQVDDGYWLGHYFKRDQPTVRSAE